MILFTILYEGNFPKSSEAYTVHFRRTLHTAPNFFLCCLLKQIMGTTPD